MANQFDTSVSLNTKKHLFYGMRNNATGALPVEEVAPVLTQTSEVTLLNAVTATGASTAVNTLNYNKLTFHIIASSITSGGTMKIQTSLDNSNWAEANSTTVSANGTTEVKLEGKFKYVRANLTARTDGTYTVLLLGGN